MNECPPPLPFRPHLDSIMSQAPLSYYGNPTAGDHSSPNLMYVKVLTYMHVLESHTLSLP